jgi:D-alanine-D-alanine ligase
MGIPYTGSGVLASALAMNKRMAKGIFRAQGLPVIEDLTIQRGAAPPDADLLLQVERLFGDAPLFVKPSSEGSTFGCSLVLNREELPAAVAFALQHDEHALIERYIKGREITAGVLEDPEAPGGIRALPLIEIIPKNAYYDYESKYAPDGSEHIIPARLSEAMTLQAQQIALQCHQALGCRGMSRADFIATEDALYLLEVNTIPGMTPTSLLPQAAEYAGMPFSELLDRLIASALRR